MAAGELGYSLQPGMIDKCPAELHTQGCRKGCNIVLFLHDRGIRDWSHLALRESPPVPSQEESAALASLKSEGKAVQELDTSDTHQHRTADSQYMESMAAAAQTAAQVANSGNE